MDHAHFPLSVSEAERFAGRPVAFMSGSALPASAHPLTAARLQETRIPEAPVALTDPAMAVVTDFTWERPVVVAEDRAIDDALEAMLHAGVGALLVVQGDAVTGLITASDIQGERPLQFLHLSGFAGRAAIEVRHLMTPWDCVPTLEWQTVRSARMHIIVEFFGARHATHVVIVEQAERGGAFVRGLISRTRLERQLRCRIE
jgi:predicted transcriptional regulator